MSGIDEARPLPKGWRWALLGEVARVFAGSAAPQDASYFDESGPLFVRARDVGRHGRTMCLSDTDNKLSEFAVKRGGLVKATKGSTLFPKSGGAVITNNRALLGKDAYIVSHLMAAEPKADLDEKWCYYWLCLIDMREYFDNEAYPSIKQSVAASILIPLPALPEQRRIADLLDAAMAQQAGGRAAAEAASIEVNSLVGRLESEMFAIDDEHVAMADIIADTRNGIYKPDGFYGRGTPILKMFNIGRFTNTIVTDRLDLLDVTEAEQVKGCLQEGDILVNRVNSRELVGKCAYVEADCAGFMYESKNLRLSVKRDDADPMYVALWMNSAGGRRQIEDRLKQIAGMATISRPDLDALSIPLPPLSEQCARVTAHKRRLEGVRSARAAATAQLAAIDALPGALLSAAFCGDL